MEVIAHRGASGYEPENTLAAFGKAIELKSDMIELDVRLSKDAEVIVFHDMTLARRTKKKGYVSKKTLEQLKAYDIGKGERIPTLKEVISFVDGRCKINIDIKDIKAVEEIVKIAGDRSNIIVSSNSVKILRLIKSFNPKIESALIYWTTRRGPLTSRRLMKKVEESGVKIVALKKTLTSKRRIKRLHDKNVKVYVWTVNKRSEISKFKKKKVDGIITNYPDRV